MAPLLSAGDIAPSPIGEPWPLWVYTEHGKRLHIAIALDREDDEYWSSGGGRTLCGHRGTMIYPGIFSRLGMPRCARCCEMIDIPRGTGHPKNDPALRLLMGYSEWPPAEDGRSSPK